MNGFIVFPLTVMTFSILVVMLLNRPITTLHKMHSIDHWNALMSLLSIFPYITYTKQSLIANIFYGMAIANTRNNRILDNKIK